MATMDVFSEDDLAQPRKFPEPARAKLIRYFTISSADEAFEFLFTWVMEHDSPKLPFRLACE